VAKSEKSFSSHKLSVAKFIIFEIKISVWDVLYLMMEAAGSVETLVFIYQLTLRHIIMYISSLTGLQYLKHQANLEITAIYFDLNYGELDISFQ
jgi:hypothetical protein